MPPRELGPLTLELPAWIATRPRTYAETMEAWAATVRVTPSGTTPAWMDSSSRGPSAISFIFTPDNGDGTQVPNIALAGNNTISNSQCSISGRRSERK